VNAALTQLDDEKIDSDGDDIPDVEELREGTDPNSIAPVSLKSQPPEWGCSTRTGRAAQQAPGTLAAAGTMLLALLLRRRRRN
jgi:MYXO-CTERM domain-containing protein